MTGACGPGEGCPSPSRGCSEGVFGYVRPPLELLAPEESARFRRAYCGLCHALGERYGSAARMILNYDFTYLAILLSERTEPDPLRSRCVSSPVRKQAYQPASPALELAADESVILAWWQLRDGVADHDWLHGLRYRAASGVLEAAYRKAAALRPAFDRTVRQQLERLGILIRPCGNYRGLDDYYCRVAVKGREDNVRLLNGVRKILKGKADDEKEGNELGWQKQL